jgi:hypothetical protein
VDDHIERKEALVYVQDSTVNTEVQDQAGWCLRFVQSVFDAPVAYDSARAAYDATGQKYGDRNIPSVAVPVWFSHVGTYGGVTKDWGHVVAYIPGRGFLSSPGRGYGQEWFDTIGEIEDYFRCTFLAYSLDLNGKQIAHMEADPTPVPAPTPTPAPATRTVIVQPGDTLWGLAVQFYGDGTRYPEIVAANNIENPNLIFPGDVFLIP